MSKIISNYSISKSNEKEIDQYHEVAPIIKVPIFQHEDKTIETFEMKPAEQDSELEPEPEEPKEPKLQLRRNIEGIVVGIEVHCACGEMILIKMDYK